MADQELNILIPQEANSHFSCGSQDWLTYIITEGQIKKGNNQMQVPHIPKVPRLLRQIQSNQTCYDPSLVSIGPYHQGKPELRDMEMLKIMFLDGCFILQFIFCILHRPEDLKMPGHHITLVKRDLLLLENQLPFQVIWSLMDSRFGKGEAGGGNTLIDDYIRHIRALPPRQ
ncbi:hypothetical protein OIU76_021402 [Salix suchowensis]|nr:hypothetical protein OIU76_021402 [Salix suchowensis]